MNPRLDTDFEDRWADVVACADEPDSEPEEINPWDAKNGDAKAEAKAKPFELLEWWKSLTIGVLEFPAAKRPAAQG